MPPTPAAKLQAAAHAAQVAAELLLVAARAAKDPGGVADAGDLLLQALDQLGESAGELYALLVERPDQSV